MTKRRIRADDYTVGWVCALPIELAAAQKMLDEEHEDIPQGAHDSNLYTLGRTGNHNVVIACLPAGQIGTNSAAAVAAQMKSKFTSIRFSLMVGIGGGVPSAGYDIRLGDVVVSHPNAGQSGVIQYDFGKTTPSGFTQTGFLNAPPAILLNALTKLKANHCIGRSSLSTYLSSLCDLPEFARENAGSDILFQSDYNHIGGPTCERCSNDALVERVSRRTQGVVIHYGTIASGNQVMKDGLTRDEISSTFGGILCFEMEAAGMMNNSPCLVIRGICDYADSHKNKTWQPYAAAAAAAVAKEVLSVIPATDVAATRTTDDPIGGDGEEELSRLPYAARAPFNVYEKRHDPLCLPNTRVDVLEEIVAWAQGYDSQCIFWLNGMAGTGKSTVARTVARDFHGKGQLGASFFFSRGGGDVSHAGKFITSIALQLTKKLPLLRRYVCEAVMQNSDIASQALRDQWNQLIFQPFSRLGYNSPPLPLVLVVDALDECDDEGDIRGLLQLFVEVNKLKSARFRVFVTSRPEIPIRLGFAAMPGILHHDLHLHNISREVVDHDISVFFNHEFGEIRKGVGDLPSDWPSKRNIDQLVQSAGGLFIYASTVCRFVWSHGHWSPQGLLRLFLPTDPEEDSNHDHNDIPSKSPTWELDKVYSMILMHSLKGVDEEDKRRLSSSLKRVVGSIVNLFEPLSTTALTKLLSLGNGVIGARLRYLHSVLNIPESQASPIHLLHPSFRDFLLDGERCSDQYFRVDEKETNKALAQDCLRLMSGNLKRDICGLQSPGAPLRNLDAGQVERCLPSDLQYACRYWVQHLQRSKALLYDNGQEHIFLRQHFLHWLEVLCLIGKTSDSIRIVIGLQSMVAKGNSNLHEFIHDARRFTLYNRPTIEVSPLQIYSSALIFAPSNSVVRREFKNQLSTRICRFPEEQDDWGSCLQVLDGHSGAVNAVAFSPDGQLVASSSRDTTVRLWDSNTGVLHSKLKGHSDCVNVVAFSPDGQLVASGSDDEAVRLWDPKTGALHSTLEEHLGSVYAVAFSPDGRLVASASGDGTVRLWDPKAGALHSTLEGHSSCVNVVAFSPNGQLIASGSYDETVRLWDLKTGVLHSILKGHSGYVNVVAFSPDGQLISSGSCDETVKLWDPDTGTLHSTLEGHSSFVNVVAFSPGGQFVASGSYDKTVRLWDLKTGRLRSTFEEHSSSVCAVAFSPDGQLVASASSDGTVRLWDLKTGVLHTTLKGHSGRVSVVAFSPDGQLVASASRDKTVRLWDPKIGALPSTLEGHLNCVTKIAFSPDGQLVASISDDGTVRLLDPKTGALRSTLEGHPSYAVVVAFPPDGQLVATALRGGRVRVWGSKTGVLHSTFEEHLRSVYAVAFSPDGRLVASASGDGTVGLWYSKAGALHSTLEGHFDRVNVVAFSPDGQLIASGSHDKTVRLWDSRTGALHSILEGHSSYVYAVTFSPDRQLVASGSNDGTVRLWDLKTGAIHNTLEGHSNCVSVVAFSPNSQLVASASYDATVRLWQLGTGDQIQVFYAENIRSLSFSADGHHLETNRGVLGLPLSLSRSQRDPSLHLYVNGQWVTWNMENILWLPPDYRASNVAVRGGTVVLGHASGRITFIEFDLSSCCEV